METSEGRKEEEEARGKKDIFLLFSLLGGKKLVFYWSWCSGANLTSARASISKLLYFACPQAKEG
jgi:hypothetical protein